MEKSITYTEFLGECGKLLQDRSQGEIRTEICNTLKNNGVEKCGLLISKKGESLAPNFYLQHQYDIWRNGESTLDEIIDSICENYTQELQKNRIIEEALDFRWENFQQEVYMRLIGREKNALLLKDVPYEEYLDMALVYYYVIPVSDDTQGVLLLTQEHLKMLGITQEELHRKAKENTQEKLFPVISGLDEIILRLGAVKEDFIPDGENRPFMYIMTNAKASFGAVCMTFHRELEQFSNEIKNSFYILPSSVHEVILVPDYRAVTVEAFSHMVKEINETHVEDTEVLSDSVYYYDREIHAVRRVG